MQHIYNPDTIWRFHVNPSDYTLYLECKTESNTFYLVEPNTSKRWDFPLLDRYVCTLLNLQYPYALLSYFHQDNLMNQSILMVYDLENGKEIWSSSELRVEECFENVLKVYPIKISPKRFDYINFHQEKLENPTLKELALDIEHADKNGNLHSINYNNITYQLLIGDQTVLTIQNGSESETHRYDVDDARIEYDYLLRIGHKVILMLNKHELVVFET